MAESRRSIAIRNAHPQLRFSKTQVAAAIALLDSHREKFREGCPPGELSIAFLTDSALAKIHADFMDDPSATDVITFEGNSATEQAGEICVSADTAARYVGLKPTEKSFSAARLVNFSGELTLYVVHGWLHLAGYDDLVPAKKRLMRAAEKRAMILLADADAVPVFSLR